MKKFLLCSLISLGSVSAMAADLSLSATSLKLSVYKFAVSTNSLCTNLVTIVDNGSTPVEVDIVGGNSLGSGSIPNGTYPCVVIEFSDNIKFTPDQNSTSANCQTSTEETMDVCRGGNGSTSALIDGTTTTCTNSADRVAMYLTTASNPGANADAFNAPTTVGDTTKGFNLSSSLTVSGAVSGKFVVNPTGKVCDGNNAGCDGGGNNGQCRMEPPTFSFSQI